MTALDPEVFVHPRGICESMHVGKRTRIWAFAHVLPNARIGCDCNICDGVFIENDVTVGDRVTVKNGVQLWDGVTLEDDVFVGPNATFANDKYPRSRIRPPQWLKTVVQKGASIGANATILPGIVIGQRALIGAGTVVTRNVTPRAIVTGNPGRIVGYTDTTSHDREPASTDEGHADGPTAEALPLAGCQLLRFPSFRDMRGDITVAQFDNLLPFDVQRVFFVYDVPSVDVRGEHAHRTCTQVLLPLSGALSVVVDNGTARREFRLDEPSVGLLIPPELWSVQYRFAAGTVLAVFCSENYDSQEYIRDYDEFLRIVDRTRRD